MLKKSILFVFVVCSLIGKAQDSLKVTLSGSIKDKETNEALIGATVVVKTGIGTVADLDGNFKIKVPKGDYNIEISMLGYKKFNQKIKLNTSKSIDVKLESDILDEVEIVADMAKVRETPVAFSAISGTKIQEELGGRDISMIANTTPGAYASAGGGGAGDSRVTIRGQNQTNIGVLVDGIPVNDMENGQVFWSNWDGLKDITKSMQIQRGLGASKLAIASVGGTMNFITKGIESKQELVVKKEWGNNNYNLMSLSYNSGLINNKWGFSLAGTYRNGDGWVDQTYFNAYSYFAKIQYMPNPRHIISIGVNGAPQSHGQRSTQMQIAVYDKKYAQELGVNSDSVLRSMTTTGIKYTTLTQGDRRLQWNPDQAVLNGQPFNDKNNYYSKPLFNLNHFWKISEKTTLSTVAYASLGTGGGTGYSPSLTSRDSITGYINLQPYYNSNSSPTNTLSQFPGQTKSSTILQSNENNHQWYGILSTATSKLSKIITLTYGVDFRYYKGIHQRKVYNLIGGDYYIEAGTNKNPNLSSDPANFYKKTGDIFGSNYLGLVKWGGVFLQGEFKKDKWTGFITATGSYSGYNRIDYYKKKDLVLADTTYHNYVGYYTTVVHNGVTYDRNSPELKDASTGWKYQYGYTLKGGVNYNINDHHNVFVNVGIMQIPLKFANVFTFANTLITGFKPQHVQSYEMGYGLKYNQVNFNFNAYYTSQTNQPQPSITSPVSGDLYITNGVDLVYKGLEFEASYKPIKQIQIEGVLSLGDWRYNSAGTAYSYDQNNNVTDSIHFDAKGVHIGNAAQNQISIGIRFMPIKGFYFKPRFTRFDKYYANFNAMDLSKGNEGRDSWKIPGYSIIDLSTGYEIPFGKFTVNLYGTMSNVLNTRYINDAQNNLYGGTFNATSAGVFFGVGRTFIFGTKLTF